MPGCCASPTEINIPHQVGTYSTLLSAKERDLNYRISKQLIQVHTIDHGWRSILLYSVEQGTAQDTITNASSKPADKSPPRIRISTVSLRDKLKYEALSYAWWDLEATCQVIVQSIECENKTINITSDLTYALRNFRAPDEERVLWIDGICINQQESTERAKYLKLIPNIFEGRFGSSRGKDYWTTTYRMLWISTTQFLETSRSTGTLFC